LRAPDAAGAIARSVGVSESTVSRVLARAGLSKLSDLEPAEPVAALRARAPGDLLHIDTKKLGRIVRPSHRVTGNRRDTVEGAGWEMLFVAIDDHARIAFTAMHPDEKTPQAVQFLRDAVAYYARLGVKIKRLLTDNGSAFRSRRLPGGLRRAGHQPHSSPARTDRRPTARPSASSSRRCASGPTGGPTRTRQQRTKALASWQHHYNWHRPTAASAGIRRCPDSARQETTS
jgi:transposase InsO family protein